MFVRCKRLNGRLVNKWHSIVSKLKMKKTIFQIIVKDLLHDKVDTHIYDAIFVCNGHNSAPSFPKPPYPGAELFRGRQSHSHDFRRAQDFEGEMKADWLHGAFSKYILFDFTQGKMYSSSVADQVAPIWLIWYRELPNAFISVITRIIRTPLIHRTWSPSVG